MTASAPPVLIERADVDAARAALPALAALLKDAVDAGAGVSFLPPFTMAQARAFWEGTIPDMAAGERALLLARSGDLVVGTAMLDRARVANGRHRAEVQKVLVAAGHRRRGIATRLLAEAERVARAEGITLLVLDTGRAPWGAEALYERAGYARVGIIPKYWRALDGSLAETVLFCKALDPA